MLRFAVRGWRPPLVARRGRRCRALSTQSGVVHALDARIARGDILDDEGQRAAAAALDAYAHASTPRADACAIRPWAYLYGPVGSGKTMLLDAFFESQKHAAPADRPPLRMHFHDFVLRTHEQLHTAQQSRPKEVRKTLSGLDVYVYGDAEDTSGRSASVDTLAHVAHSLARAHGLICLDELCVTDLADALIVGRLLDRLLHEGVRLAFTSNQPPAKLFESGRNRRHFVGPLAALLRRRCVPIRVGAGGVDYREVLAQAAAARARAAGAEGASSAPVAPPRATSRAPASEANERSARARRAGQLLCGPLGERAFESEWRRSVALAGGEAAVAVPVAFGRSIEAERAAGGAMRAPFDQLCDTGRGTPDYYALARRFDSLFVEAVPQLGRKREEAARRLISLVDVAYDERVRLVMCGSACAEPSDIFAPLLHGENPAGAGAGGGAGSAAVGVAAGTVDATAPTTAATGELRWMILRCTSRLREMTAAGMPVPPESTQGS